jgi:hypothetical protein
MILLALLAQAESSDRPFRATLVIEESALSGDDVTRTTGTLSVRPGDAAVAKVGARRIEKGVPLEVWLLGPARWHERFEVVARESIREPALPESVVDPAGRALPPLRARKNVRSLALVAEGAPRELHRFDLKPRQGAELAIRAWVDPALARPVRVEIESATRRTAWTLEAIRDIDMEDRK